MMMMMAKKPVKSPHSGGIRTPEPNEETIEIGIVRLGHVAKVKLTCIRFYHLKLQVQLYFPEIVICCENWPSNIRKLMYVQVDIVLSVKKASR